jgi:hypothetical protein
VDLLSNGSDKGKVMAMGAMRILASGSNTVVEAITEAGAIPLLVELMSGGSDEGRVGAAGALMSLTAGNYDNSAAAVAAGAIHPLVELMRGGLDEGSAFATGTLGNLAYGNDTHTAAVVAAGAIPPLVELLSGEGSAEGRRIAAGALFFLTRHDAGRRQVEGLGYTQDRLRELQAERSPGQ